jgi:hypothetical protein
VAFLQPILLERHAADHGGAAELLPHAIDRVLAGGGALAAPMDEIGRVCATNGD